MLVLSPSLIGALSWPERVVERAILVGTPSGEAVFKFKNTGSRAIRIVDIDASCGCASATTDKSSYQTEESGELKVVFESAGEAGSREVTIAITTDDQPAAPSVVLTLKIVRFETFALTPAVLRWNLGEARVAKYATLTLKDGTDAHVRTIASELEGLAVWVDRGASPNEFLIGAMPDDLETTSWRTVNLGIVAAGVVRYRASLAVQVR